MAVRKDFGLTYRDKDNSNKTPLCIHRTPLGTHERFIGFLIEHCAGNFPLWLAPDQVRVITLNDDAALINCAKPIVNELRANMVRVDSDFSATPFNSDKSRARAKISNAERGEVSRLLTSSATARPRRSRPRSRRGERPSPPRRPAGRKAEGGSRGGYFGEHQRAEGVKA